MPFIWQVDYALFQQNNVEASEIAFLDCQLLKIHQISTHRWKRNQLSLMVSFTAFKSSMKVKQYMTIIQIT